MPTTRKKRAPKKKRSSKKKAVQPKKPIIEEWDGFKLGDKVWARYFDKKIIQGAISQFYPDDNNGPVATIITADQGYRSVLVISMSHSPIKKGR